MSYALLPAQPDELDDIEASPKLGSSGTRRSSGQLATALRYLKRGNPKVLLSAASATVLLLIYTHLPESFSAAGYGDPKWPSSDSATYRAGRPELAYIQKDGELVPPSQNATIASWPEDYPLASGYLRKNGVLPDVSDPWPERPSIAKIWLSPRRFPEGLQGLPYRLENFPEVGKEGSFRPEPGLHDPPIPEWPSSARDWPRLQKVPREELYQAKDWSPPASGMPKPKRTRPVQATSFPAGDDRKTLTEARRQWVKRAFLHAWEGYKAHAYGHDEISPVSRSYRDSYNAWGASMVDNLDTLLMMNLSHEYNLARTHIRALDFTHKDSAYSCEGKEGPNIHLFETTIRYLGGLLAAYDLSGDGLMLERAKELGDWLLPAFSTKSGFPIPWYDIGRDPKGGECPPSLAAEIGSLSMEFTRLSQLTGDPVYFNAVQRITDRLAKFETAYGSLLPVMVQDDGATWGEYTIGGMVDSYYEYLIKQVALLGDSTGIYAKMYARSVEDLYRYLIINVTTSPDYYGHVTIGKRTENGHNKPLIEHLATFAGGMLALGAKVLNRPKDLQTAVEITDGAIWAYQSTATGLMPELAEMRSPESLKLWEYSEGSDGLKARIRGSPLGSGDQHDKAYKGRPETIESVFYLYRITGDPAWQDQGWKMFTAFIRNAITSVGYANVADVHQDPPPLENIQESFVLAETLKYYYLLFSPPDLIDLDKYVFNTEAHPFRLPFTELTSLWSGSEAEVSAAYADPRDRHLFEAGISEMEIPTGRGTAKQQMYRFRHCR